MCLPIQGDSVGPAGSWDGGASIRQRQGPGTEDTPLRHHPQKPREEVYGGHEDQMPRQSQSVIYNSQ